MRLVTHNVGTGLDSKIWLTQALPLTLPLVGGRRSARAMNCAASVEIGGNTSSTSSNSSAERAVPFKNTCAICSER